MIYQGEIEGVKISLRAVAIEDCNDTYLHWLNNPNVNKFLETRWGTQTLDSIISFVEGIRQSDHSYLFAITLREGVNEHARHIGNIKIGPINPFYAYADISYFIGEEDCWGKGIATEAISLICKFGFEGLGLHKIQAGVFGKNIGSIKALKRVGFKNEGCLREQLYTFDNIDDHLYFGILREELMQSWCLGDR